jgi:signal peptidase
VTWRAVRRTVSWLVGAALTALLLLMWPQSLGGRVAYVKVDGHSMDPTFHTGDLAVVRRQSSYQLGDAVAYRIPRGEFGAGALVIHRLKAGDGLNGYVTRGDNRTIDDPWHPRTQDVVGRVRTDIPGLGVQIARFTRPIYLGGLVAALTVAVMLVPSGGAEPSTQRARRGRHAAVR